MSYFMLKWIHVLSSTVLFGTGIGSAFYLLCACLTRDPTLIAPVARWVVRADFMFTATTFLLQPATGFLLADAAHFSIEAWWLKLSIGLFAVAFACWIPVVWLQIRMRNAAEIAATHRRPLTPAFQRDFVAWFVLGVPAFAAFLAIFYLMIAKPGAP